MILQSLPHWRGSIAVTVDSLRQTELWQRAFEGASAGDVHRQRLETELLKFRDNVELLVSRIQSVLPSLTMHDVTHLDALWDVADLIAGEGYPLNPLEAFVFGGAVLLHDSAMCWEAYEGGQSGVRGTKAWLDAHAFERERSPSASDDEQRATADFIALRELHAAQAAELPSRAWFHPESRERLYLIDDASLRTHLGRLIGQVASSHHWDVDDLTSRLPRQCNAPLPFPSDWSIDPIKVACLLRCADAAHVNQARAPDMLHALVRRTGLSQKHWLAQNRMTGPALDVDDPTQSAIVYTSTLPFREEDAPAWWIANDAVRLIDTELRSSNDLLRSLKRSTAPEFKIKRVSGTGSVEALARHLQVQDWTPCAAELTVGSVVDLIGALGGDKLYGAHSDKMEVVVRELIQNARDAIVARRSLDSDFVGEIVIRLEESDGRTYLYVEDDGVGMSPRVMTGPLLDFGSSLWKSSLLHSEFPGLRSSAFRPVGAFGIGFFSAFMISDAVRVVSRRWEQGLDYAHTLTFGNGLSLRPVIRQGRVTGVRPSVSTQVRLRLNVGHAPKADSIEIRPSYVGAPPVHVTFSEYVAALVVGLDVQISIDDVGGTRRLIHAGLPGQSPAADEVLRQLSFSHRQLVGNAEAIQRYRERLRVISHDGRVYGFAAVSADHEARYRLLTLSTTGGLATSLHGRYVDHFVGYLDHKPLSAKRDAGALLEAPRAAVQAWAEEQMGILDGGAASDSERWIAALNLATFDVDPSPIAKVLVTDGTRQWFTTYDELAALAERLPVCVLKASGMNHVDLYSEIQTVRGAILIRPLTNSKALSLDFDEDTPREPNGILGCLFRAIIRRGRQPSWTTTGSGQPSRYGGQTEILAVSSSPP